MGIAALNPPYENHGSLGNRGVVPIVIQQHAEEAAILWNTRREQARAPHVKLHLLRRFDDRIAAHLDGLAVAGEAGWKACAAALETPGGGQMFAAAVLALQGKASQALEKLLGLAQAVPESQAGLISAFGWVSADYLRGTVRALLASVDPFCRMVGLAACSMHQADPGEILCAAILDTDPVLKARALRVAGELGRSDLLGDVRFSLEHADDGVRFWAARSAALLGNLSEAIPVLLAFARSPSEYSRQAMSLLLCVSSHEWVSNFLRSLATEAEAEPSRQRSLIEACGLAGDSVYVPWLISHMAEPKLSRLAGESFSLITGLDLAFLDLDRKPPEKFEAGPNDHADDSDVSNDPDDGLPWPDPAKIEAWWGENSASLPSGFRYFMGAAITPEHCVKVLHEGFQRQRRIAAQYLCLLRPGQPRFNIAAPAWRQKRILSQLA